MDFDDIGTTTERTARIVYRLMLGWQPRTQEVACVCNLSNSGAWRLMSRISLEVPVYLDEDHHWRIVDQEEGVKVRHYVSD